MAAPLSPPSNNDNNLPVCPGAPRRPNGQKPPLTAAQIAKVLEAFRAMQDALLPLQLDALKLQPPTAPANGRTEEAMRASLRPQIGAHPMKACPSKKK